MRQKKRCAHRVPKWVPMRRDGSQPGATQRAGGVERVLADPATYIAAAVGVVAVAAYFGYLNEWWVWTSAIALMAVCVALEALERRRNARGLAFMTATDAKKHNGLIGSLAWFSSDFSNAYEGAVEALGAVDRRTTNRLFRAVGDALVGFGAVERIGQTRRSERGGGTDELVLVCEFATEAREHGGFVLVNPMFVDIEAANRLDSAAMRRILRDCGLPGWIAEVAATDGDAKLWRLSRGEGYVLGVEDGEQALS